MSFIQVPPQWLSEVASGVRDDVHLYWSGSRLAQYFMWQRLRVLTQEIGKGSRKEETCIDVGGGLGLILPTLAQYFSSVSLLDLNTIVAKKIVEKYNLNVEMIETNFLTYNPSQPFDVGVAAAFLEHFEDTEQPVKKLYDLLKPGGRLFVDVPTENIIYRLGRKVGNIQKPPDHYHGASEILPIIQKYFRIKMVRSLPAPFFPLFVQVSAIRKE